MSKSSKKPVDVRWGLVGAGDVCEKKSGPPLYQLPGHRLVALTRRDAARGKDFARRHAGEYLPDLPSLLAHPDINAVYVATPAGAHAEQTIAAAEAGKDVLVEKPMAMTTKECRRMVAACQSNGVLLAVAYYRRGYPSILDAKARLDANEIGRILEININDQFPPSHRLDLVHYFAGDVDSVRTEKHEKGLILHAVTRSGAGLRMNLGWKEVAGAPEQVRIQGEDGEIFIEDLKGGKTSLKSMKGNRELIYPPLPWTHWGLIENFGFARAGRCPLACDGLEGLKSTAVLDTISALEPGQPYQKVDYNNPPELNRDTAKAHNFLG
ncbi:MAG: Gfo/Idh/MocA family oxidoreductase [Verrucomicrobia bacterium]|nr:Gfo/Idh/MocA family oxidoreductase [Verrucomicrobiota bacterium]MCH8512442.1 Gfo/Idh/MocA family oxidoreductase [Kiritimatiellia bacterium]